MYVHNTLGPACTEVGYCERPTLTSKYFPAEKDQGTHISRLTKFHDISRFFKKIPGIFSEYF